MCPWVCVRGRDGLPGGAQGRLETGPNKVDKEGMAYIKLGRVRKLEELDVI